MTEGKRYSWKIRTIDIALLALSILLIFLPTELKLIPIIAAVVWSAYDYLGASADEKRERRRVVTIATVMLFAIIAFLYVTIRS